MSAIDWLQRWYAGQVDGDWEHEFGVRIDTLDNPGWTLEIDLTGTSLEGQDFEARRLDRSDSDWINCRVEGGKFRGWGGPLNLSELVEVFRDWANKVPHKT